MEEAKLLLELGTEPEYERYEGRGQVKQMYLQEAFQVFQILKNQGPR